MGGTGAQATREVNINNQVGIVLELANLQNLKDKSILEDEKKLEQDREYNR